MKIFLYLLLLPLVFLSSCHKYTPEQSAVIAYIKNNIAQPDLYQVVAFEPIDSILVKDTLAQRLAYLQHELKICKQTDDSLTSLLDSIRYNPYAEKLRLNCLDTQPGVKSHLKKLQANIQKIKAKLTSDHQKIAWYSIGHQYNYGNKKVSIKVKLDHQKKIIPHLATQSLEGANCTIEIFAFSIAHGLSQAVFSLRLDGQPIPVDSNYMTRVKPGKHTLDWKSSYVFAPYWYRCKNTFSLNKSDQVRFGIWGNNIRTTDLIHSKDSLRNANYNPPQH